ncbi:MAG: hypothetical protein GFH27_549291n207 [Chloroflexi bacterium AL-W]|nr:hypothetical protein [Chloroflexi bacterium AL-N1]NOK67327.1 hypothetical protein [Chloroflexi bacterium AL-N10]NOK75181.1 hypothetical protein [Chloroflexi bacterium AL-N5]NOK81969.1 hypothetical protein [Chloroflexi bacterium AL-W]NOK89814.1 hypothetical protein [Chloroflexi bacterium AL-N15]
MSTVKRQIVRIAGAIFVLFVAAIVVVGTYVTWGVQQQSAEAYLPLITNGGPAAGEQRPQPQEYAVVFVSRQILPGGSIYWDEPNDMPGVGPHSRFRVAAPGQLLVREVDGRVRILVDGAQPTSKSLNLIDVNAPDVSYDGQTIVFAGLARGDHAVGDINPGAWRIYAINVDGSNLRQITASDLNLTREQLRNHFSKVPGSDYYEFADRFFEDGYDDTDPIWLPDGRIAFASTRWPGIGHYSGVRTTNLYVVGNDGNNMRRITAERNGAERPLVDPLTGKIVYARWWRNHRFPVNSLETIRDPDGGYVQKDGVTTDRDNHVGGPSMFRNAWQATSINPDGTEVAMWTGHMRDEEATHVYGGAFTPDGALIANFFPMFNMTEAAGFGGLRRYERGPGMYTPLIGITSLTLNYIQSGEPTSFGIFEGAYAVDPDVLPDGRLIFSWTPDIYQDYGLYIANGDGTNRMKLYDNPGTTELRARVIRPRSVPPIIRDTVTQVPSLLPPKAEGPYDTDGTFVFDALNVYANAPVDTDMVNAPPIGSADTMRFYIDHQRSAPGSFPRLDWPIFLGELPVNRDGSVRDPQAPANVPLFEQMRSADGTVPLTGLPYGDGATHVAGMNFGRPGTQVRCMGCHAGHSMMEVPDDVEVAKWTNVAPSAEITVSSARDPQYTGGVVDRRVMKGEIWRYWTSEPGQSANGQWVRLTFPVPINVRTVRLYNPRTGDEAESSLQVHDTTVILYGDADATNELARQSSGAVLLSGTDLHFNDVSGVRTVYVQIDRITGTFYGAELASLAEIEVIASGE